MCRASLRRTIEEPWTTMEPLRVGPRIPSGLGTPDAFITAEKDGRPHLRIDAYAEHAGPFEELLVWREFVVLGWADVVHLVDLRSRNVCSVSCHLYFEQLYPCDKYLLIASASELVCLNEQAAEVWRRGDLGIDGVVIDRVDNGLIEGRGEWDPPGDWRPFRLVAATGRPV
jgi:hypothetical protein